MLKKDQIEFYLNRGDHLGFVKDCSDENYIGWIAVSKSKFNQRQYDLSVRFNDEYEMKALERIKEKPYFVNICELNKAVYEEGLRYPIDDDYRVNEGFSFALLEEVEEFLLDQGKKLEEIKWMSEIPWF